MQHSTPRAPPPPRHRPSLPDALVTPRRVPGRRLDQCLEAGSLMAETRSRIASKTGAVRWAGRVGESGRGWVGRSNTTHPQPSILIITPDLEPQPWPMIKR